MSLPRELRRSVRRLGNRCRSVAVFVATPLLGVFDIAEALLLRYGCGPDRASTLVQRSAGLCLAVVALAIGWALWCADMAGTPLPASARTVVIQLDYGFASLAGAMLKCCCACLLAAALVAHRACALCISVALHWPLCTALWLAASVACSLVGAELA